MNLNLDELVGRTNLKNKADVVAELKKLNVISLNRLDNLPGNYGRPWFCGNPTNSVVIEVRESYSKGAAEVPTIDSVIEVVSEPKEPEPKRIGALTPVTELEIEGVNRGQLRAIDAAGIETVAELFEKSDKLEAVDGVGATTKLRILTVVTEALENQ